MPHGVLIKPLQNGIDQRPEDMDRPLIAEGRIPVQVMAVEDREAQPNQGHLELRALGDRVALDELAIGIADHEVRLVGEDQRAHVPEVRPMWTSAFLP